MNTLTKLFAATALLASTSTAALAQVEADADNGSDVTVETDGNDASAEANSGENAAMGGIDAEHGQPDEIRNIGTVVSAIQSGAEAGLDLTNLGADTMVTAVLLSSLEGQGAENSEAVENALNENPDYLDWLRSELTSNSALGAAIEPQLSAAGDFTLDHVVAVTSGADGSLTVYVDDTEAGDE